MTFPGSGVEKQPSRQPHKLETAGATPATAPSLPAILTEQEAAEFLRVSVRTLQNMRWHGKRGPLFMKVGGRVRYDREELAAWFKTQRRSSTTEAADSTK
jgi:excisionase family DNA binding protein